MKLEALKDAATRYELVKAIGAELESVNVTETEDAITVEWDGQTYYLDDFQSEAECIVQAAMDGEYEYRRNWRADLTHNLAGQTVAELTA